MEKLDNVFFFICFEGGAAMETLQLLATLCLCLLLVVQLKKLIIFLMNFAVHLSNSMAKSSVT